MAKAEGFQDLSLMPPQKDEELWRWLYTEIRSAILDGRLKPGMRLPSTRSLARQYDLSRGTVTAAFDQLQAEGYTTSQPGSGTFVAFGLPDHSIVAKPNQLAPDLRPSTAGLSNRVLEMIDGIRLLPASHTIGKAFRNYEPAVDLFPVNLWARVAGRVLRRAPRSMYGQGNTAGYQPLRKAIAEYVGSARGVRCDASQVIITSGAQQGLDLVSRILCDPGDQVLVEDPCYPGARATLRAAGVKLIPLPVDREGLKVEAARKYGTARMVYTTPANQFPLGVTMSLDRRLALLQWAVDTGAWIIEDEYDAEYRYYGRPVAALQSLDQSGCVVYVGTFTKMLFNALRMGFLVLPERLVTAFEAVRSFLDRHPPTLDQAILAEFILDGHFGHHVRRMRQTYAERISVLTEASRREMSGLIEVEHAAAGMRTVGWIRTGASDTEIAQRARARGLELSALSDFTICHAQPAALMLGFAGCNASELRRGVGVLAGVLGGEPRKRSSRH